MSRPESLLNQLDALDALAEAKITTAKEPPPPIEPPPAAKPAAAQASAVDVYALLKELKRDISVLQREQQRETPPPSQEQQLYGVLAELRRDIAALQHEQRYRRRKSISMASSRT